ncbi:MAG: hypothetical protein ABW215_21370 [Kibdelosporangium sp.]
MSHRFVVVSGLSGPGEVVAAFGASVVFAPGREPLRECAAELAPLTALPADQLYRDLLGSPRALHLALADRPDDVLIVVDRFEEIYTLGASEIERVVFVDALVIAAEASDSHARVVLDIDAGFAGELPDPIRIEVVYQALVEAASAWEALGRHPDALYRGRRLIVAREWARQWDCLLTEREREFLGASLKVVLERDHRHC